MIKQVGSSLKQTAKQTAKQVAQQIAREPLEILKSASRQVGVTPETSQENRNTQPQGPQQEAPKEQNAEEKQKKAIKSQRLMQAYENELEEIRQNKKQEEMMEEQKEFIEEEQKKQIEVQKKENIIQVISKKGRKMFGKVGLKREQTKTEAKQPPSG